MVMEERDERLVAQDADEDELVRTLQVAWNRGGDEAVAELAGRQWLTLSDSTPEVIEQLVGLLLMDPECAAVLVKLEVVR